MKSIPSDFFMTIIVFVITEVTRLNTGCDITSEGEGGNSIMMPCRQVASLLKWPNACQDHLSTGDIM